MIIQLLKLREGSFEAQVITILSNVVIASKGIVLLFLNNFYWFQLNRTLGPIATTLMRVIHDVMKVAFAC